MKKRIIYLALAFVLALTLLCSGIFTSPMNAAGNADVAILGASLNLGDTVYINYYVPVTEGLELLVKKGSVPGISNENVVDGTVLTSIGRATVNSTLCEVFRFPVTARELAVNIYARAKVDNETGPVLKYSVLQYAFNKRNAVSPDQKLIDVIDAMLVYGEAAQVYCDNENMNRPANADYYELKVVGGTLPDGTQKGLYHAGEGSVTITAPATSGEKVFHYWKNSSDERVAYTTSYSVAVGLADEVYTAVYATAAEICAESGHNFEVSPIAANLATAASCTDAATYYKVCSLCGTQSAEAFAYGSPLGHIFDQEVEEAAFLVSDATCSSGAIYYYSCTCGEAGEETFTVGDPVAHFYTSTVAEGYLVSAATCTEAAVYRRSCSYCGIASASETFTSGAALGHDFTAWDVTPATCLVDGVKERHCQRENCNEEESQVIPATGHSWPTWDITPASCLNDGLKRRICDACGEIEATLLPATGHSYSESWTADYFNHWHEPTCSDGAPRKDVTAHTFNASGVCTVCSYVKPQDTEGLQYALNDGGTSYRVTGIGTATPDANGYIVIPRMYNSKPVTTIASEAFDDVANMVKVVIPDTVRTIESNAFNYCGLLEKVMIGSNQLTINAYGFMVCYIDSVTFAGDCDLTLGEFVFQGCNLTKIELPNGMKTIGSKAFWNNFVSINTVIIPDTVTSIHDNAFSWIDLENVTIPITFQGKLASNALSLKNVVFTKGNAVGPEVAIENSAFYGFATLESVTFPSGLNGLKTIGQNAFYGCTKLQGVVIPSSTTNVAQGAFDGSGLVSVTITGHPTLGSRAFGGCDKLTSVTIQDEADTISTTNAFTGSDHILYLSSTASGVTGIPKNALKTATVTGGLTLPAEAFMNAAKLESVTLPAGMTTIGQYAFYGAERLTSIALPSGLRTISEYAFGNTGLTSINIPNSVMNIKASAFNNCDGIESLTLNGSSVNLGNNAFANCDNLRTFTCNGVLNAVGYGVFANTPIETATLPADYCNMVNGSALRTVVLTDGYNIPSNAFVNSPNLESVSMPDTLTSIGQSAFSGCIGLTSIDIPDGVTMIGQSAFQFCRSLSSVTIPSSVNSIGQNAFASCAASMTINFGGTVEQWNAISKDNFVGASAHYTAHCTNGDITV